MIRSGTAVQQPRLMDVLTVSWVRNVLLIGTAVACTQQAYGTAISMLYGTVVLEQAGLDTRMALIANVAVGVSWAHVCLSPMVGKQVVAFLSSWAGLMLVSRMGRRPMLMIGQIGALVSLALIVISSAVLPQGPLLGWVTLALLLLFLVFGQGCISTVTWFLASLNSILALIISLSNRLLQAEIYPLSLRGIGAGMGMMMAWGLACTIGQLFPIGVHYLGQAITFCSFFIAGSVLLVFVWIRLPETRGKSLEELEHQFQVGDWKTLKEAGKERMNRKNAKTSKY